MPKRRYVNAKAYLDRVFTQQVAIRARQGELVEEFFELEGRHQALEDRAEALVSYDWQSRHHFPLVAEVADGE